MLFKNLILYRLPENWSVPAAELEEALGRRPLQPCSGFDMQTRGFVVSGHDERLLYTQGKHYLLALGVDRKLLPASVINQQAKERAVELAAQQGYPVGRRQMRELKARVTDELRARALTSRRTTHAWLNLQQRWLAVNTTSASRAEELVETLRETLGSFAVTPVASLNSPAGAMATWLTQGRVPGRFDIDQDLELQAVDGGGATIRYVNHPLDSAEIRSHLGAGKTPTRLGLVWNERIAFMLQQNLYIKRVRFLDVYKDDNAQGENPQEQFDIDFALMTGELSQLLEEVLAGLGGEETAPIRQAA
ncbi:MAG: recombination-associated protein RdgC [Gammaproteobacteria bacterium]